MCEIEIKCTPFRILAVTIVLCFVYELVELMIIDNATSLPSKLMTTPSASSLMVLKLPRSGSSWFTQLLNAQSDVYVSKEIIQRTDTVDRFITYSEVTHYLTRALLQPKDKFSNRFHWWPSGRFMEDYIVPMKFLRPIRAIGFTLNPEHVEEVLNGKLVSIPELAKDRGVKNIKVIHFTRSNIVKTMISGLAGARAKEICGSANLRGVKPRNETLSVKRHRLLSQSQSQKQSENKNECIQLPIDMNYTTFANQINMWANRYHHLEVAAEELRKLPYVSVEQITYESLQLDHVGVMRKVSNWLGNNGGNEMTFSNPLQTSIYPPWRKRLGEDLSEILSKSSWHSIVMALEADSQCECLLNQLKAKKPMDTSCSHRIIRTPAQIAYNSYTCHHH